MLSLEKGNEWKMEKFENLFEDSVDHKKVQLGMTTVVLWEMNWITEGENEARVEQSNEVRKSIVSVSWIEMSMHPSIWCTVRGTRGIQ